VRHVFNLATHRTGSIHLTSLDWRAQWQTDSVELWCTEVKMKGGDKTYGALSEPPWRNVVHQRHAQMGCGSGIAATLILFLWIAACFVLREDLPARITHIVQFSNWRPKFESIRQILTFFIYEYICRELLKPPRLLLMPPRSWFVVTSFGILRAMSEYLKLN
jgi:hypothetical protein